MTPAAIAQREFLASNASKLAPDDPRHGKASTYNRYRCKCEKCIKAWRDKCKEMKDQRLAMTKDESDPRHGTPNFYGNFGCRCERCTLAWRAVGTPRQKARRDKIALAIVNPAAAKPAAKKAAAKTPATRTKTAPPPVDEVPETTANQDGPLFLEAVTTEPAAGTEEKKPKNPWGVVVDPAVIEKSKNPWGAKLP